VQGNQDKPVSATQIARELAAALDLAGCEYAIGGAIALGFWAKPRSTMDVDVTLFLPPAEVSGCLQLLLSIGCTFSADAATRLLSEHGYCQVEFGGGRIDVFLPLIPFYEEARKRRRAVEFGDQRVMIWDAETLCVFKLMFFRLRDLADVEEILRVQGHRLDRDWVMRQILAIYGQRDPRVARWEDLVRETGGGPASTGP
jgi:hypothetical protein